MIRALVLALSLLCTPALADTTVYVVRHAEKMKSEGDDPGLSDAGHARAQTLAATLRDVPITAIYTTKYKRNRQTVAPAEAKFATKANVYDAHDTEALAKRLRTKHRGASVLVAGHSNTVPEIVAKLGVKHDITLTESDYDDLFIVRIDDAGRAHLTRLHFGAMTD